MPLHEIALAGLLAATAASLPVSAQSAANNEVTDAMASSFSLPLKQWFQERHSFKEMVTNEISIGAAFNNPLFPATRALGEGLRTQGDQGANSRNFTLSVRDNPISYWFVAVTAYAYVQPQLKRPWNPDFTYSFGYDDWHPYTFSLTYSNYGGNRLRPNRRAGEKVTDFEQGGLNLGWKFKLPKKIETPLLVYRTSTLDFSVNQILGPRYADLATNKTQAWKMLESLSCHYNVYGKFYWNITAIYYPQSGQQQPWDPDFTYGFGYFDYRPGKFSVEYNNYGGNRFPWKKQGPQAGNFRSGGISVMWNVK